MDWLDLLAVQGTLKSLLQHQFKNISSLVLSFLYSPTLTSIHDHRKNHRFDQTFVGKVMSLLFNILSRSVITFLPRSKSLFPTPQLKSINSSVLSFLYGPTLTSIHDNGKTIALTRWTFVGKIISLLFNMLSWSQLFFQKASIF